MPDAVRELKFRDPTRAAALAAKLQRTVTQIGRSPVSVMHVCGSHEQAIARGHTGVQVDAELGLKRGRNRFGEPRVLKAPA